MLGSRSACALVPVALIALAVTVTPAAFASASSPARSGSASRTPHRQQVTVEVWLSPDFVGAEKFATAVSTPGNPRFHHYLSPDAYTARFAASEAKVGAVVDWLSAHGLHQVRASGRDYVSASGSATAVRLALGMQRDPDSATAPTTSIDDRAVPMPTAIAGDVLGVTGLDRVSPAQPRAARPESTPKGAPATCSAYWSQHVHSVSPSYQGITAAALPICGYSAAQLRAAYGVTSANSGRGQTVALTESETTPAMSRTLKDYAAANGLPIPKPGQFRQITAGGGGHCPTAGASTHQDSVSMYDDESEMDSEAVYAMAPHADQLMVVGNGCDEEQALLNATLAVLTGDGRHPRASIVSNSWHSSAYPGMAHAIEVRAAAEGVGLYFASGDAPGVSGTEEDPFSVVVGGTTLGIGANGQRVFETGWSDDTAYLYQGTWDDLGIGGAAGGGTSLVFRQPAYQRGVVPASMSHVQVGNDIVVDRTSPDISAVADSDSAMLVGHLTTTSSGKPGRYETQATGGTSLATPLIAGLVADAQQGQRTSFGFTNPLFYRLAGTSAVRDVRPVRPSMPQVDRAAYLPPGIDTASPGIDVFDAQQPPVTQQVTAKGYDTMTGVGTPNGVAFIAGLRRLARPSQPAWPRAPFLLRRLQSRERI